MHRVIKKLILEATLAQNFTSFNFCSSEICLKTQDLFLTMMGKTTLKLLLLLTSATPLQKLG